MNMRHLLTMTATALAMGSAAHAQFVASHAGPLNSTGEIGNPGNGVFYETYQGPSALFSSVRLTGTVVSAGVGSWAEEARWNISKVGGNGSVNFIPGLPPGTFPGFNVDETRNGLFWASANDEYRFEAYESYVDVPDEPDAIWSNVQFEFSESASINQLGSLAAGDFDLNTFGSNFDTELALYTADGTLLAHNDDAGDGLQSQLLESLSLGEYLLVVGGFNSTWGDSMAIAGNDGGEYILSVNDATFAGSIASGEFAVYSFSTIPAPSAFGLLALAALSAGRRRRGP